eukprot:CAMPEP_0180145046 /NCGR_PEP_ID=MMETSP0986-20121125/17402_1 /TAXON_ID=697907 /ORGANISM="non described non described, Strain CCMP2293" /LENGTH=94 /DNA_ID=CAMNT_0022089279 /DNA_START=332 /DNA_END=615 /DNA_ORIENTATION=+
MVAQTSALFGASNVHSLLHAGTQSILGCSSTGFFSSAADAPPANPAAAKTNAEESRARLGRGLVALHSAGAPCRTAGASGGGLKGRGAGEDGDD